MAVCSCLEDMHKNALHFRFSCCCCDFIFASLVAAVLEAAGAAAAPLPVASGIALLCCELILCFEQSFVAYFKALLEPTNPSSCNPSPWTTVMYVLERKTINCDLLWSNCKIMQCHTHHSYPLHLHLFTSIFSRARRAFVRQSDS